MPAQPKLYPCDRTHIGKVLNNPLLALRAKSNRLADTRPLMSQLLAILPQSRPGTVTFISES